MICFKFVIKACMRPQARFFENEAQILNKLRTSRKDCKKSSRLQEVRRCKSNRLQEGRRYKMRCSPHARMWCSLYSQKTFYAVRCASLAFVFCQVCRSRFVFPLFVFRPKIVTIHWLRPGQAAQESLLRNCWIQIADNILFTRPPTHSPTHNNKQTYIHIYIYMK